MVGNRLHALRQTGFSLKRYVVDQVGVDVDIFILGTPMSEPDEFFVRELFGARLVQFVMHPQISDEVSFMDEKKERVFPASNSF